MTNQTVAAQGDGDALHSEQLMTAFKPCMARKLVTGVPPAERTISSR
jgi:hypothetical protein